jgi:fructose-specific phosphotransferase system component IIB
MSSASIYPSPAIAGGLMKEGNNMPQLKNKIAVVTGGSSGIGLATAKRFVEEGAYVFIAGRRQAELDKAVAEIGSNVTGVKTDIAKLEDLGDRDVRANQFQFALKDEETALERGRDSMADQYPSQLRDQWRLGNP